MQSLAVRRPRNFSIIKQKITIRGIWLTLGSMIVIAFAVVLQIIATHHQYAACAPANLQSCTERARDLEGSMAVSVLFIGLYIYVLSNRIYLLIMFRRENREILRLPQYDPDNPATMLDRIHARMSPNYLEASSGQLSYTISVIFYSLWLGLWIALGAFSYYHN